MVGEQLRIARLSQQASATILSSHPIHRDGPLQELCRVADEDSCGWHGDAVQRLRCARRRPKTIIVPGLGRLLQQLKSHHA